MKRIASKVIAERIKWLLPGLIHHNETGHIPGRNTGEYMFNSRQNEFQIQPEMNLISEPWYLTNRAVYSGNLDFFILMNMLNSTFIKRNS